MTKSIFREGDSNALNETMFLGKSVNVARYDQQRFPIFEKLVEKQLSFYWRPEEVDVSKDANDFNLSLSVAERFIFVSNLSYQILLDSVQGRAPAEVFGSIVSLPELENWITTWNFSETIHSRSYTHIIRNLFQDPSEVFDEITNNEEIKKRAKDVSKYYDSLLEDINHYNRYGEEIVVFKGQEVRVTKRDIKKKLYLCMNSVNALEAIRFYVSFACTFAFAERSLMEGNAKIMRLIARDENLHLSSTQHIINLWRTGKDDPEMVEIAKECEAEVIDIFKSAMDQEKEWAKYLFSNGSMLGMNADILCQYIDHISHSRMSAIGFEDVLEPVSNPLPWMNGYLNSDAVQVAPQETEIASYLVGQIDSAVDSNELAGFEL